MNAPIFLDNQSTTPVDPRVTHEVLAAMQDHFGNASSTDHCFGDAANDLVETARKRVLSVIRGRNAKVVFTSGATESINLVISHVCRQFESTAKRIVLSAVEHSATLETCAWWVKRGILEAEFVPVDRQGRINLTRLEKLLEQPTDLVAIMAANNETGNVYPVQDIADICRRSKVPYLCDATQAVGKTHLAFDDWNIDYLALSGHKIYGPKGVGALVLSRTAGITPLFLGGGQEFGIRPGTLNVPGITGLGRACMLREEEWESDEKQIAKKRDRLEALIRTAIPNAIINGTPESRLAGNLHISIPGIPNDAVIARIRDRLAISRGASCSSGLEQPSHVLKAMQLTQDEMEGAFRFGIGKFNSDEDIELAARIFIDAVRAVQSKLGLKPLERV